MITRRTFIGSVAAFAALDVRLDAQVVPNSAGTERPKLQAPPGACDCHHHIYDGGRFKPVREGSGFQPNGRVEEYRLLQRRIGTTRDIIVTPLPYAGDNRITLDAIKRLVPNARGIALLRPDATDIQLRELTDGGIRGVRFSMGATDLGSSNAIADIEPISKKVANFGWHVQILMRPDQIVQNESLLNRIPTPIVFDHLGVLGTAGLNQPAYTIMRRLIDKGRTWVKLSGAYLTVVKLKDGQLSTGMTTDYAPATVIAKAFVAAAPERLVWGSDWPHPTAGANEKPDDAKLFDLLSGWAPNQSTRHRILVENAETLYGFPRTS
jgi:predicted TIM-barrel fold metal-dependent hydrolase